MCLPERYTPGGCVGVGDRASCAHGSPQEPDIADGQMLLTGEIGDSLSLWVSGYQFPDAEDPRKRYSWHMVSGEARCAEGSWDFEWQALTCDESPRVSAWLRAAASNAGPAPLTFVERNLGFRLAGDAVVGQAVEVVLDLEFLPPWNRHRNAGDPTTLRIDVDPEGLRAAADAWDEERAPFPDLTP
jgi:hypothetical protein